MEGDLRDRISELPEFIIHKILYYLTPREAAGTATVSKTLLRAFSTSPVLSFHYSGNSPRPKEIIHAFSNTLLRYRSQNLLINTLSIFVTHFESTYLCPLLDESIETLLMHAFENYSVNTSLCRLLDVAIVTALEHGLQKLDISIDPILGEDYYALPRTMFIPWYQSLLASFTAHYCKFPQHFASTVTNAVTFPVLKRLNLFDVNIDDTMIQKLFSGCPLIQEASFFRCHGFKKFMVGKHQELMELVIEYPAVDMEVEIEYVPSIYRLDLSSDYNNGKFRVLEVGGSHNLKHLSLERVRLTEIVLNRLVENSPLLELLNISRCSGFEGLYISSRSLKHLKLELSEDLVKAEIDAPNFLTLQYQGVHVLSLSLNNASEEVMISLHINDYERTNSSAWFLELRELQTAVTRAKLHFFIRVWPGWSAGIDFGADLDFRANPLPLEHKDEIFNPNSSSVFPTFADNFFSISRPTSIFFSWINESYVDFIKFLVFELMRSRESKCCSSRKVKCWRHYVEDVRPEIYKLGRWQLLHWQNYFRGEISTLCDEDIRFSLKWYKKLPVHD